MSSYELTIQFTNADTQMVNNANQKVTIVKEVGGTPSSPVIWLAIEPFESNDITWEEVYGVYASTTKVEAGALIVKSSAQNPASNGVTYPFTKGAFGAPGGDISDPNSYAILNGSNSELTFGLAQGVTANGTKFDANPLNAVPVLNAETAVFTPIEKLQVYLQADFDNGVVISDITSPAFEVDLTHSNKVTIHYDSVSGNFVAGPLNP